MEGYLTYTLEKLKSGDYGDLTIVLGNESCDLDSAICAVTYAAFLNWQYNQIQCKVCTRANRNESTYKQDIFVPILNVNREDYNLKTEVQYVLTEHEIDPKFLVFRDDFNLEELVAKSKTSVVLVDHYVLASKDAFLAPHVTEIIDHRPQDSTARPYPLECRTTIQLVGSCCSLVTSRMRDLSKLVAKEGDFFDNCRVAADMLYCGIILDTVNFSKELKKGTPTDEEAVSFLENYLVSARKKENVVDERQKTLDRLVRARKNVSNLTAAQLLRKDVKLEGDVLVPSLPILVEEYLNMKDSLRAIAVSLEMKSCTLAVLLGMSLTDGDGLTRDVAVIGSQNEKDMAVKLAQYLEAWTSPSFQLEPQTDEKYGEAIYFKQNNLSASRKQYMPAIRSFIQERNAHGSEKCLLM